MKLSYNNMIDFCAERIFSAWNRKQFIYFIFTCFLVNPHNTMQIRAHKSVILSKQSICCNILVIMCVTAGNEAVTVNLNNDDLEEVPSNLGTDTTQLLLT